MRTRRLARLFVMAICVLSAATAAGRKALAAGSLKTGVGLALTRDGAPVLPEVWTLVPGPTGALEGVLNYTRTYEMVGSNVVYTGHRLDLYGRDGGFVRTVAADALGGYPSFVAVHGGQVYLGRADWADPAVDAIGRVVGGLAAEGAAVEKVMDLVSNWAMAFAPDGQAYAMHNDGVSKIVRLDVAAGEATTVLETPGYGAGLDFAPNGDLYLSTYGMFWMVPPRPDQVLRITAAQLAAALPVDFAAAQVVAELPPGIGGAGLAVDEAGNVVFAMNGPPSRLACIYAGKDYSAAPAAYDLLAEGKTWLLHVEALGDVSRYDGAGPDHGAFVGEYPYTISYVPEPATAGLLAVAAMVGLLRRMRRQPRQGERT